jgi:hypothetical protein
MDGGQFKPFERAVSDASDERRILEKARRNRVVALVGRYVQRAPKEPTERLETPLLS